MDLRSHGIVALVCNTDGKFLLLEDARELMKGKWAPPHGRCKMNDQSEEQSVIREVKEETGLAVTPLKKLHTQKADTKVQTVSFWLVEAYSTDVALNSESSRFDWVSISDALRLPLYPGTRLFFERARRGEIILS